LWFVELQPEEQLCRMLAREELTGKMRARTIELLASPIRWPLFLEHARNHDICPIIYRSLEMLGFASVPDPIRSELAKIFGVNAMRCEFLGKETAKILRLLDDAGIPAMPLKGIALAASLYLFRQICPGPLLRLAALRNVPIPVLPDLWLPVSLAQRAAFPVSN
jgi:hypothetical protein